MTEEKRKPGYDGWNWLPLTEDEKAGAAFIQAIFEEKLRQSGFPEGTRKKLSVEVDKASLTISDEEGRSGAFHNLAGGEPFYRLTFKAEGSMIQQSQAVESLFMLMQVYAANGGASMSMSDPVELTHDFRADLFAKGSQLAQIVDIIAPYIIKPQNSGPKPPSP
jgi:hypothetical protein